MSYIGLSELNMAYGEYSETPYASTPDLICSSGFSIKYRVTVQIVPKFYLSFQES